MRKPRLQLPRWFWNAAFPVLYATYPIWSVALCWLLFPIEIIQRYREEPPPARPAFADPQSRAEQLLARALAAGVPCHVRQWHQGRRGWFVVRNDNYQEYS